MLLKRYSENNCECVGGKQHVAYTRTVTSIPIWVAMAILPLATVEVGVPRCVQQGVCSKGCAARGMQ